jgi:hypothetical protein
MVLLAHTPPKPLASVAESVTDTLRLSRPFPS